MNVISLPRRFSFAYQGDGLPHEVVVHTLGRKIDQIEPIGWEPTERTWKVLEEIAHEKHLDWLDEMDERTPEAQRERDRHAEAMAERKAKYWEPNEEKGD